MEGEAVGNASAAAGTSSAIAATATGREDSSKTNEPTCDMPTEITSGTTADYWQPLRPRIQFSTDLRKELSLDVLEALGGGGGSSADDAKSLEEPSLDLASAVVRADMDLISELSAPDLPPGHQDDSTVTDTLLRPSSATPLVEENHHCPDGVAAPPTSDVSLPQSSSSSGFPESSSASPLEGLPGNGLSALAPSAATVELTSDFPSDEVSAQVSLTMSLASIMNSPTSSAGGSLVENADPLSYTVVPAASDKSDPVSSTSIVVSATEDDSGVADASVELQELPELGLAGPPISDIALAALEASQLPVEPVSTSVTSCSVGDGDMAIIEAQQVPVKPLPSSPGPPLASDAHPFGPATATLPLESVSYPPTSQSMDTAVAAAEPLLVALGPVPLTSGDVVTDSTLAPVELPLAETQSLTPGGMGVYEVSTVSVEDYPSALETLLSTPAVLPASDSPMAVENSPLAGASLPSAVSAPTDDPVVGSSVALISPPLPHDLFSATKFNVPASNFSPAVNSLPVQVNLSPPNNNTEFLDSSTTSSAPLVTPTVLSTVADITPVSVTPPPIPLKVLPLNDSVSSPPLTARFWDVPSSQSPGVSLSVYFDGSRSAFRARKINRKRRSSEAGPYLKDVKGKGLSDVEKVEEVAELETMLEAQKKMLKWQIDEIQRIASLQFQLTGSNPLSEEAMWEVLGVKGAGKKSGDLLSPEVLQGFQEIFAMKDTLTKREARDISFTSGASLTQVREYFAAQRSLVRRLVQQAHDEAGRLGIKNASEQSQQITVLNSISEVEEDLGFDKLSGAESIEKIIEVMRAEKGFAGQIQLLQVILRTDSAALILRRFLEKGGLKILGGWLVEAATEQQTSLIYHLLKVLDHLPMSSAVSHQMKPFVQSVNNLRFHTATAVARQARLLVAKWVKLFSPKTEVKSGSSPGSKFSAGSAVKTSKLDPSGGLKRNRDPLPAQSVPGSTKKRVKAEEALPPETKASQIAGAESPRSNGMPQGASEPPSSSSQPSVAVPLPPQPRWSSTLQPSESAVAAVSVSRKRLAPKSLGDRQDRRKVLPVEDNHLGKSVGSRPATISKTSRPLSTDDVYKAKKLERLMQEEILKSKRRPVAVKGQSVAQDGVPKTGAPKKPPSQAALSVTGAVRSETLSSSQGNGRGGALMAKSSQEEKPTAFRTKLPMRTPEHHDVKMAMAPTSSQDLFQTMGTPTPSPTHPGSFTGDMPKDLAYKGDSNFAGLMEIDPLFLSFRGGGSGLERSPTMHHGVSSQSLSSVSDASGVDPAVSDISAPNDPSHLIHSLQVSASESKDSMSAIVKSKSVEGNVHMPPASSVPFESRLDELSGLDAPGSKGELGIEQDLGKNSIAKPPARENSLSDFYAALRASMIRWRIPPEYQPEKQWNVAAGEDSKEREVQSGRVKREEEAYYPELSSVPEDPKDPWEEEPNYDDSLTLEIFVEGGQQKVLPEVNNSSDMSKPAVMNVVQYGPEASLGSDVSSNTIVNPILNRNHGQDPSAELLSKVPNVNGLDRVLQQLSTASGGGGGGGNHDPDLLALLLRNPELVNQLTSGQAFPPNGPASPGLFMQQLDPLKQLSSGGNNGAGLSMQAGDLGQERLIPSNNSKALGIPLQPGRPVSSVDQTPPETMRVQDTITMMHHPGMGQQQTVGFVPQGGVDNRFLTPRIPSGVPRNVQDTSGWEQLRVPPPPPPPSLPPTPVINQVLQPPLSNQPNKQSNWLEPQGWVGMGRPPLNPSQTRSGHEQLHTRQTLMTQNMQLPSYGGIVGVPQVERRPETSVVSQPDARHSQRPWLNGSHGGPPHESNMMHVNQDSGANRNNRWPRPHVRPDEHGRSGNRDFPDFNNGRPTSVVDNRSAWAPNERTRPVLPQFQGSYGLPLPPPPPPPYPAPLWQGQEGNLRLVQGVAVNSFPHGRDLRTPQQQLWHNNMNPTSRQVWRGQQ